MDRRDWPGETWLFRATRGAVRALLRPLFCFRVEGLEHFPAGPAVLVANHPSAVDPLFLAAAVPERLLFMAAAEFFALPALGWAMRTYGCIPVRRGEVDSAAVREALLALAAGRKVAIFPEGRVSPEPATGQRGAALLASRARVPVVPVAISGTGRVFPLGARFPRPGRVAVRIGLSLPPPGAGRAAQDEVTAAAMAWIQAHSAR